MQVRGGALTIMANTYVKGPDAATPAPYGPYITFNMGDFVYNGGNLLLEIRHTGNTGSQNLFVDTLADSAGNWSNIASAGTAGTNYGATTGAAGVSGAPVAKLQITPVPEPSTVLALIAGVAVLAARRRKA